MGDFLRKARAKGKAGIREKKPEWGNGPIEIKNSKKLYHRGREGKTPERRQVGEPRNGERSPYSKQD